MTHIVRIIGAADGSKTPHDGRYLVGWDPHVEYGTCAVDSSGRRIRARRFKSAADVMKEWKTVSRVQLLRPDGEPNRPLSALTIEIIKEPER